MVEARKLTEGEKRLRIYLVVLSALLLEPNTCLCQYYYLSRVAKEELWKQSRRAIALIAKGRFLCLRGRRV